jgi:ATP-binding cassette subfamily C protein
MLCRLQDGNRPVALLRVRGQYELQDAMTQSVRVVDESVAMQLSPFAHCFFRSFPSSRLQFGDLVRFSMHYASRDFAWLIGLGLLTGTLGLLAPLATAYVFDALIPSSERGEVLHLTAALIAVAIAATMFTMARSMAVLRIESRTNYGLQAAVWDRALSLPAAFFKRFSSGDLAGRLSAINAVRQAVSGATLGTMLTSVFALLNIGVLFYYSTLLALLALALLGGAAVLILALGVLVLRHERKVEEYTGRLAGIVLELVRGISKLRVSGAEARAFANWAREFAHTRRVSYQAARLRNVSEVFFSAYGVFTTLVVFGVVASLLLGSAGRPGFASETLLTTGEFIAFFGAFGAVMGAVSGLSGSVLSLLRVFPAFERARPVLEALPESDERKAHPGELKGKVDVVNVTFRYSEDGPPVLNNVSFSIRPGGFIAIVGPSGSGKSTLLRCLLGFETPTSGGVFYDDHNLVDLDPCAVRRQMGVVLQQGQVMPGSIMANIVGTSLLSIDDAWQAARDCGLEEEIQAMPMGMHTLILEGGGTLSGGQRQRILIARAIVHRPRIILFDEATSALDNRTQEIVTSSLGRLRATRIVIAHRLSTVMKADRIIVLDEGKIVQVGRYDELISQAGPFQQLAKRQIA